MSEQPPRFISDPDLERELEQLGPVMRRQADVDALNPDPVFVQSLRDRLLAMEPTQAVTAAPERRSPLPAPIALDVERRKRRPRVFAGGLAGAVVAAAILALVLDSRVGHSPGIPRAHPVAFAVPTPNATQLAVGYPYPIGLGGGGGPDIPPWKDTLELPPGIAYPGKLRLSTNSLSHGPARLPAFQLESGAGVAAQLATIAHQLGILGTIGRSTQPDGTWVYASDRAGPQHFNVHSVAVNLRTGELIYRDLRNQNPFVGQAATNDPANVLAARAWLSSIGWPGARMPLFSFPAGQNLPPSETVFLGWARVAQADMPEAQFYLVGRQQVQTADIYPPILRGSTVAALGHAAAWSQVAAHRVAVGVAGNIPYPPTNGTGALRRISVVQIYTHTPSGALYLVPAYRFEGPAHLAKTSAPLKWVAIVSAAAR